jgi:hypothetical protein
VSTAARRWILRGVFAAAAACVLLGVVTCRWTIHCRLWNGLVWSLARGRVRYFAWDTTKWRIEYRPGFSVDDEGWGAEPWPYVHWDSEPAYYAAPGRWDYIIAVPLWMPALLAGGIGFVLRRRGWHREHWECRRCGYDLRGSPTAVCPECGTGALAVSGGSGPVS